MSQKEGAFSQSKSIQQKNKTILDGYSKILSSVFEDIKSTGNPERFFSDDFIKKVGFYSVISAPAQDVEGELKIILAEAFVSERDEGVDKIVESLALNYSKPSVIDSMYQTSRLKRFREYYACKHSSPDELVALRNELREIKEEYCSMLKNDLS